MCHRSYAESSVKCDREAYKIIYVAMILKEEVNYRTKRIWLVTPIQSDKTYSSVEEWIHRIGASVLAISGNGQ